jgi:hypothetical protein
LRVAQRLNSTARPAKQENKKNNISDGEGDVFFLLLIALSTSRFCCVRRDNSTGIVRLHLRHDEQERRWYLQSATPHHILLERERERVKNPQTRGRFFARNTLEGSRDNATVRAHEEREEGNKKEKKQGARRASDTKRNMQSGLGRKRSSTHIALSVR